MAGVPGDAGCGCHPCLRLGTPSSARYLQPALLAYAAAWAQRRPAAAYPEGPALFPRAFSAGFSAPGTAIPEMWLIAAGPR